MIILYIVEKKYFSCCCLQTHITEKILKCHVNDCLKISGKEMIKTPKKGEYVRFKNYERKTKSAFMI